MAERTLLIQLPGFELLGQEKALISVAMALRDYDIRIIFLTHSKWGDKIRNFIEALGFEVFALPLGTLWSKRLVSENPIILFKNVWAILKTNIVLWHIVKKNKVTDLILGNATFALYLFPAFVFAGMNVIYRHGDEAPEHSKFHQIISFIIFAAINKHVTNCLYLKSLLLEHKYIKECRVIRNIPPTFWADRQKAPQSLNNGNLQKRGCVIIFVGQIAVHKGILVLFEACRILFEIYPTVQLEIVGGIPGLGLCRDSEIELILTTFVTKHAGKVRYHGFIDNPKILYESADIHVMPSIWEDPAPNVILEAKCAGLPSVAFRVGGVTELINHKQDGYVCEEISPTCLAMGIKWIMEDARRLRELKMSAMRDCQSRFGLKRFREEWLNLLQ